MNQQQPQQMPPQMGGAQPKVRSWIWIVLIVVVLAGAGYFGWYYFMGPGKKTTTTSTPTSTTTTPSTSTTTNSTTSTADWKTYTNSKYSFSVKYPTAFTTQEATSTVDQTFQVDFINPDVSGIKGGYWQIAVCQKSASCSVDKLSESLTTSYPEISENSKVSFNSINATKIVAKNNTMYFTEAYILFDNNNYVFRINNNAQSQESSSDQRFENFYKSFQVTQ